jgi:putative endopeptidase
VTTDDWPSFLSAAGAGADVRTVIVAPPSYFDSVGAILREVPVATWQAYLAYNLVSAYAPYSPFVAEDFAFEQHMLRGVPEIQPRRKRAVATVDRLVSFALGRLYVERYFPLACKDRADAMIAHLMDAYRESIATLDWMGPETRRQALDKLAAIRPMIGYPVTWRDYTALVVRRDDLVGNVMRARGFDYNFWLAKLGGEVDRPEWHSPPQTINAFYSPSRNAIVFPAGILQQPFLDAGADDAANYGAIGTVIGHEISHAFDDQGSRFDGEGNLRNWWTEEDRSRFDGKTRQPHRAMRRLQPAARLSGQRRADARGERRRQCGPCHRRAGLSALAWRLRGAGHRRLHRRAAPVHQLRANLARHDKMRDAARIERLKVDPHAPGQFRANGSLRNQGSFDSAFDVKPGDAMCLPPEQRISPWRVDREMVCKEKAR